MNMNYKFSYYLLMVESLKRIVQMYFSDKHSILHMEEFFSFHIEIGKAKVIILKLLYLRDFCKIVHISSCN